MATAEFIERLRQGDFDTRLRDEAAFKTVWQTETTGLNLFDAAFAGGVVADRLSWVFVSAYQSAVRACFPVVPDGLYSSFAVSEDRHDAQPHNRMPGTSLNASGKLTGTKTWIASSRLVDHLVVTLGPDFDVEPVAVLMGDGVKLSHRDQPGFLGDMSQGMAHFDAVPCMPITDHRAGSFGLAEPFFIMVAGVGYLFREVRRLNMSRAEAAIERRLPELRALYDSGFDANAPSLLNLYQQVSELGKDCAAHAGNLDDSGARDWSANGRLLGMYGRGLRSRVNR